MKKSIVFLSFFLSPLLLLNCNKECKEEVTWENEVEIIIQTRCAATSACHGEGASQTEYTSYSSMSGVLNKDKFEKQVITDKTMPANGSLTAAELELLKCWVNADYPE